MTKDSSTTLNADWTTGDASAGRLVSGTVSAALAADEKVAVYTDNGATFIGYATLNDARTAWAITDVQGYSAGWTYTAKVVDAAGNEGSTQTQVVNADLTAAAPVIDGVFDTVSTTTIANSGTTTNALTKVTGTGEIGSTIYLYDNSKTNLVGTAVVGTDGKWEVSSFTGTIGAGSNSFSAVQLDATGNESVLSNLWTVSTPGTNMFTNGDFSQGNVAVGSSRTYLAGYTESQVINTTSGGYNFQDSTGPQVALTQSAGNTKDGIVWSTKYGTNANQFAQPGNLFSDNYLQVSPGNTGVYETLWGKSINVVAGQTYQVTFDYRSYTPNAYVYIGGTQIWWNTYNNQAGVEVGSFKATFTATTTGALGIGVKAYGYGAGWHDYAFDNLSTSPTAAPTDGSITPGSSLNGATPDPDTLSYTGGVLDTLDGGDTITVSGTDLQAKLAADGRIAGGSGIDTLKLAVGTTLDLEALTHNQTVKPIEEIEVFTLQGSSTLTMSANDVLSLGGAHASTMSLYAFSSTTQTADGYGTPTGSTASTGKVQFVVNGTSTDKLNLNALTNDGVTGQNGVIGNTGLSGEWLYRGTTTITGVDGASHTYKVYDHSTTNAQVLVDLPITVNTLMPVTITSISADSGLSAADFITNDTTLVYTGKLPSGFKTATEKVKVQILNSSNVEVYGGDAVINGSNWTLDKSSLALAAGAYTIKATIVDGSGNVVSSYGSNGTASQAMTIDTTLPVSPTITVNSVTADNLVNADEATGLVAVTGTVGGEVRVGDAVTLLVNNTTYTGTVQAGNTFSINVAGADLVADSDKTINATLVASDLAGNTATATTTKTYTADVNTAPVATQSSSTSDPFGPALLPNYSSFVDGTSFNKTSYTGDGTYTWGSTDVTVTGNTGTVMSTSEPGSFLIGENVDEKVNFVFDKAVSKVVIDFSTVTFSSTSQEELVVYVNGARYSISASEITNGSNVSIVGGAIRSSSTTSSASGTLTIVSQPGTTGITEISTETNWMSGVPNGIIVGVVPFENTSSSEPVVTESFTVQSLFGASYSDSDSDAMKGVLVTAAGDATAQASLGKYQYSTDGGTTWIDVASSLSETNALYLPTTALVRFSPVAGNTLTAKPSFTAHLVDSYSLSPNYTAGQTYDASVNGGSTSISEDTVTLGLSASDVSVSTATSVNEGTASVFTVSLPNNTGGYIDLAYSLSGAATAADYGSAIFSNGVTKNADGTLNVPAGVTSFTVTLPIVADKTTEGAEVLTMTVGVANASTTINDTSNGSNSTPVVQPTFAINGASGSDQSGYSVSNAGDVNGDGLDDIIIGAPGSVDATPGKAYVVFGQTGTPAGINLSAVAQGNGGFVINGESGRAGFSVSAAGDVNGDGLADVVVGTTGGRSYVVYGTSSTSPINLSAVVSDSGGFVINQPTTPLGNLAVSSAGDVNGDGYADLIIRYQTEAYVQFGSSAPSTINLASWSSGAGGMKLTGINSSSGVSAAGDINGDGLSDVIVGDFAKSSNAGGAYVVYGTTANATTIGLSTMAASQGFAINGQAANNYAGYSVSAAGDVNGDGLADVIVGAYNYNSSVGRSYVVFGTSGAPTSINLTAVAAGSGGYAINGLSGGNDYAGYSVSSAGDINGDGLADVIIGATGTNPSTGSSAEGGRAFVVYGKTGTSMLQLSDVANGSGGFYIFNGQTYTDVLGWSVSSAGDMNGDGYADLIVGATGEATTAGARAGKTYVIYGGSQYITGTVATGTGTAADELVVGTGSGDTLTGGGGVDRFSGGAGNDTVVLTASDVTNLANTAVGGVKAYVAGGEGYDTVQLSGGTNLNLTTITNAGAVTGATGEQLSRINSIERIDLGTDTAANTLTLTATDVKDMAGFNTIRTGTPSADGRTWTNVSGTALGASTNYHQLVVDGSSVDNVTLATGPGAWYLQGKVRGTDSANVSTDYNVYTNGETNSQILVKNGVAVTNNDPALSGNTISGTSLDLGTVSGVRLNLIEKRVSSTGKVYFFLDANANGTAAIGNNTDNVTHQQLDDLFNGGPDTTGTSTPVFGVDTERTVVVGGYTLVLPNRDELGALALDTALAGNSSSTFPTGWSGSYAYWSSTNTATTTHVTVSMLDGTATIGVADSNDRLVVLEVLSAPVIAPIVFDLNRDGTISYTQQLMDVNTDGKLDFSAWAAREDGVLVWNKFGNGLVTDASQYAFTTYGGTSDLEGLRVGFDSNADGVFDAKDAKFAEFGVWQDADGDGTADAGELRSLADVGIASIDLQSDGVARSPADGVTEAGRTEATLADGSAMLVADAAFTFNTVPVLNLDAVLKDSLADITDGKAELLKINLSDLLQLPATADGQHVLQVNGDAVDAVELEGLLDGQPGTWTNSGPVTQNGHTYNVYQHSGDQTLQVLIDQHIATSNVHSS